jgi:hypothetical protein
MADPDDFSFDLDGALSRIDSVDGSEIMDELTNRGREPVNETSAPLRIDPFEPPELRVEPSSSAPLRIDPLEPPGLRVEPFASPSFEPPADPGVRPAPLAAPEPLLVDLPGAPPPSGPGIPVAPLPPIHEATPVMPMMPVMPVMPVVSDSESAAPLLDAAPMALVGAGAPVEMSGTSLSTRSTGELQLAPNDFVAPRLPVLAPPPAAPPAAPPGVSAPTPGVAPPLPSRPSPRKGPRGKNAPRRRRLGVRVFFIVLVLAGVVLASLTWGRGYLFPDEWDSVLVPLVEDVEATAGLTFDDPVAVRLLPSSAYGAAAASVLLGDDWSDLVPRWRALGLASGEPSIVFVESAVATAFPALYHPAEGEIIISEELAGRARTLALSEALTVALVDQHLGADLDPGDRPALGTADRARAARVLASFVSASSAESVPTRVPLTGLNGVPAPVAYEVLAVDRLGASFAGSIGVVGDTDGALADLTLDALDSFTLAGTPAPPGALSGEEVDGTADAIGADAWHLVFASLLDGALADDVATALGADLLIPTARGESACFTATFTAASPESDPLVGVALRAWAQAMPPQAGATAVASGDGTHQLSACDPGAEATNSLRASAPAELVARQAARFQR